VITLDYAPLEHQADLHTDRARFRLVMGGRRSGKSKSAIQEMIAHCLTSPSALAWWVAPTYTEAREVGFTEFMEHYTVLEPAIRTKHEGTMHIEFLNGSKLYFKGADRRDSLRGRGLTFLVVDEAAFINRDTWQKVLRPALSDKKGRGLLLTTPNGRNWIFDLYTAAVAAGWSTYHWPSYVNPLITEAELDEAKATLSESDFRQEYLGEFVTKAGAVYSDFSEDNVIEDFNTDDETLTFYLAADFGYANPSSILLIAVSGNEDKVVVFDEIYRSRMSMDEMSVEIMQMLYNNGLKRTNIEAMYTDPAGNAAELTSGVSPVDVLRRDFTVVNKGTEIPPGLQLVRAFVCNAMGERRLFVTRNCKDLIRSMYGYTYADNTTTDEIKEEPLKDGKHDHACDALRYFFVNAFDHAKWVAKEPVSYSYIDPPKLQDSYMKRCSKCRTTFVSKTPKDQPPFLCKECANV